jgi:hypothetical protein
MIMAPCLAPIQLAPSWLPRRRQLYIDADVGTELGANLAGTEMCNLGANNNSVEPRVYFLKSYYQGRICEHLSKKELKNKKDGTELNIK